MRRPLDDVRVLIIGAGKMGEAHARAFQSLPGVQVTGVSSRSGSTAEELARKLGVPHTGTHWISLVERARPDLCVVAVSHEANETVTREVIEAGFNVLTEKPVALTSAAIAALADLADARGVLACAAMNRRFYPGLLAALDQARLLGPLHGISITAPDSAEPRRAGRSHSTLVCDSWLRMNTIHAIDLLRMLGGEPSSITGFRTVWARDRCSIVAALAFSDGLVGTFSTHGGFLSEWELRVFGEGYEVRACPLESAVLRLRRGLGRAVDAEQARTKPGLRGQAAAVIDAVRSGAPATFPLSDLRDHASTMSLVDALEALPSQGHVQSAFAG